MTESTITFKFLGKEGGLVNTAREASAALKGVAKANDEATEAYRRSKAAIDAFKSSSTGSNAQLAAEQAKLRASVLEDQAAGNLSAKQAQDQLYQIESAGLNKRIQMQRAKLAELKALQQQANAPGPAAPSGLKAGINNEVLQAEKQLSDLRSESARRAIAASASTAESNQKAGFSVVELASKYFLLLQALQLLTGVGKAAYDVLIGQNIKLQQSLISTQAALVSTNKIFKNGVEITDPGEAIKALDGTVNDALAKIRKGSLDLVGITSAELIPLYQNIAGQIGQIGGNLDDAATLTLKFAAALGTFNIPLAQQRQEISSILQGNIIIDSVLAHQLNITSDMVRTWKAQGTAVAELNKRLEASAVANKLNADTITGYASNIQEIFENVALAAGADPTAEITKSLGKLYKFLLENQTAIQDFVAGAVATVGALIDTVMDNSREFYEDNKQALSDLYEFAKLLAPVLLSVAVTIEKILIKVTQFGTSAIFKNLRDGIATLKYLSDQVDRVSGKYADGAEATNKYGKGVEAASKAAKDAADRIKNGDRGAALAKALALDKLDKEIELLKKSGLQGVKNREVIAGQVQVLESWKQSLADAGGKVTIVSRDTTQLTRDLEEQNKAWEAQGKAAELATARLSAAAKRARLGGKDSAPTTAREEQATLYAIEQQGLEARLKLAREKEAGIAAIAAKGGDVEQKREFTKQLTAAQTEQAQIEGQIAEKTLARRKAIQDLQLKDLDIYQAKAADTIAASESALLLQAEQTYQADLTQKQRFELSKLEATQDRIKAEIAAEQSRTKVLNALKFDDPDEREANEAKIRASKQKTAALTLRQLETQRQIEQTIAEIQIKQISDRAAAEKRANDEGNRQLGEQKTQLDQITQAIERQNKLRTAQNDLAKAQTDLLTTGATIQASALDRALELRKKLNDATTSPAVRRVLQQQLEALTGNKNTSEVTILQRKFAIEQNIANIKAISLQNEQAAARNALAVETQRNELAAKRAIIEARIAETNAKTALGEAKKNLAALKKTPGADPTAIADAEQAVRDAESNVGAAAGTVQAAQADLEQQKAVATQTERALAAQQASALAQQQAAEFARLQAEQLTIVEAKSRAIAAGQNAKFTQEDFKAIRQPPAAVNNQIQVSPAAVQVDQSAQLKPLYDLVSLFRTQAEQTKETNAHLRAIANRRPTPPPSATKTPAQAQPYQSFDGMPL